MVAGFLQDDFVGRALAERIVQHLGRPAGPLAAQNATLPEMGLRRAVLNRKNRPFGRLFKTILAAFTVEIVVPPLKEFRLVATLKALVHRPIDLRCRPPQNLLGRFLAKIVNEIIHTVQDGGVKIPMNFT